jgi:hypothetical protein
MGPANNKPALSNRSDFEVLREEFDALREDLNLIRGLLTLRRPDCASSAASMVIRRNQSRPASAKFDSTGTISRSDDPLAPPAAVLASSVAAAGS